MGRSSPNSDDLRNEHEASRPEKISFQNANYLGKQNYDDALGRRINERKEDREIYVRDISPYQNNDRNNDGKYAAQGILKWCHSHVALTEKESVIWQLKQNKKVTPFYKIYLRIFFFSSYF
ncbi:unnamed protein product [Rhizophagus irregularis]|uniref:Uncharacterized protein n=1 Tax=Rhizophagus irregularis TaxID=588596 RepID=A0A2N1NB40_9GLOM|nr:hypothetical protein RhiirC2_440466 [Rhizophagus irregularis]CAB4383217.1 unnamed protein product [Rhizophagus irregularis]CAB5395032.1 unnamed protein product [Rhizophagus irregularis]